MDTPNSLLVDVARPAATKKSFFRGDELRFQKQFSERRMCQIRRVGTQNHFGVARQLDFVGTRVVIRQRNLPNLGMSLRRYRDFQARLDVAVDTTNLRLVYGVDDFVFVRLLA